MTLVDMRTCVLVSKKELQDKRFFSLTEAPNLAKAIRRFEMVFFLFSDAELEG